MRPEPLYRIPFTYPERWAVGLDAAGNSGPARSTAGRPSSSRSRRPSAGWSG